MKGIVLKRFESSLTPTRSSAWPSRWRIFLASILLSVAHVGHVGIDRIEQVTGCGWQAGL